jgi:anti-sigma factor ChrR (cupin superfamily)
MLKRHPSADLMETYLMGQLSEPYADVLEVHLLVCDDCRQLCSETEEHIQTVRAALNPA